MFILKEIYLNIKPLIIFIFSLVICSIGRSYFESHGFFNDKDNALNLWIGVFTLIFGIIFWIIELLIRINSSFIKIELLDENKQGGTTPIYLDNKYKYKYKDIYVKISIDKLKSNLIGKYDYILIEFPKGVSVNLEDYENILETAENVVKIEMAEKGINRVGIYEETLNIQLATEKSIDKADIYIKEEIYKINNNCVSRVFTNIKKDKRRITLRKSE